MAVQKTVGYEQNAALSWSDPAVSAEAIDGQQSDTVNLTNGVTRAVHVGVAGNLAVIFEGDTDAVTLAVLAGTVYPFRIKRLMDTNTTATGVHALR